MAVLSWWWLCSRGDVHCLCSVGPWGANSIQLCVCPELQADDAYSWFRVGPRAVHKWVIVQVSDHNSINAYSSSSICETARHPVFFTSVQSLLLKIIKIDSWVSKLYSKTKQWHFSETQFRYTRLFAWCLLNCILFQVSLADVCRCWHSLLKLKWMISMLTLTARTVRRDRSWGEHGRLVERMSHGEDSEKRWVLRWAQKTGREDSHDEDSENRWVLRRAQKTGRENESLRGLWEEMGFEAGTEDWQRGSVPVRTVRRDGSWGGHRRLVERMSHCEDSEKRWVLRRARKTRGDGVEVMC